MKDIFDVAIVGGGASGFFAACQILEINADAKVVILEKSNKILSKVRISGGGRCNVTHNVSYNSELVKHYPNGKNFLKQVFKEFTVKDTVAWFESHGVAIKIESDGRMFPESNSSESIIKVLHDNSIGLGGQLKTSFDVAEIVKAEDSLSLVSRKGEKLRSKFVIIASGGFPKETQFEWIKALGHGINTPVPSLFTFNIPLDGLNHLQGLSVNAAKVQIVGENLSYEGPLLITHWGISGPSVLKLSAWGARLLNEKHYNFGILINWIGAEFSEQEVLETISSYKGIHPKKKVCVNPLFTLPSRLWQELMQRASIDMELMYQDLGKKSMNRMLEVLYRLPLNVSGKTTYKEEFVTSGGVLLKDINNKSMESQLLPNVYFTGEVIDIDGITGGFNFQSAWSTAYMAARNIVKKLNKNNVV
ncbi:MAG: putative Rossmann fold flavoprotein [Marivirga sp.]|jgi:predicted Rossmann fold flavoprotein